MVGVQIVEQLSTRKTEPVSQIHILTELVAFSFFFTKALGENRMNQSCSHPSFNQSEKKQELIHSSSESRIHSIVQYF